MLPFSMSCTPSCPTFPRTPTLSLHLYYSTGGSLSITHTGIGRCILFEVPDLSSGLSFEQMVGFGLVHNLLGILGCGNWMRLIWRILPNLRAMPTLCRSATLPPETTISKWRVTATIGQFLQLMPGRLSRIFTLYEYCNCLGMCIVFTCSSWGKSGP